MINHFFHSFPQISVIGRNVMRHTTRRNMNYKYNSISNSHFFFFDLRDIVELLLSYEASCNSADDKGSSPLHLASWAGHAPIVEVLLTRGPSISNVNLTVNELLDLQGNLTFLVWLLCFLTQFFLISLILKNSRVVVFCLSNLFIYSPELAVPCYFLDNMKKCYYIYVKSRQYFVQQLI